jgi:hypothetical protein
LTIPNDILGHSPLLRYEAVRAVVQTGDLMLCSGRHRMSRLIRFATRSPWSHVAIVVRLESIGRVMVCESVEKIGVRTIPLHTFLFGAGGNKPYPGKVLLARHARLNAAGEPALKAMTDFALDQLGDPFAFGDIVKIGARILWGATQQVTPAALEAQHEFICSEYAALCFEKAGVTIPWDGRGFIAPCDFALDPSTSAIGQIDLSAGRT